MRPLLELNNISYSYHTIDGETKALSDISFQLAPGEFAAVVGPSGCGKSTLLSLIAGLIEAENGTIFLDGEPSEKSFRKSAKIGYMLQHDHLFEWRSILKNVLLGAEINKSVSQETKQRAKELLRQYGLKRFINSRPSELSGGMRQRAALIRTLMPNPELLLLDEPFSALDYQTQSAKMDLPRWCSDNLDRLNILATFNLCNNGAVFVREGLGVELTFEKLVETNAESDLCFRPITPPLHTKMYVIWKKYQIFTPVANLLLEEIKKIIVLP